MNKKNLVLAVVVVALVAIGVWYAVGSKKEAVIIPSDNSAAINDELSTIDIGDINSDLADVDATLKNL